MCEGVEQGCVSVKIEIEYDVIVTDRNRLKCSQIDRGASNIMRSCYNAPLTSYFTTITSLQMVLWEELRQHGCVEHISVD